MSSFKKHLERPWSEWKRIGLLKLGKLPNFLFQHRIFNFINAYLTYHPYPYWKHGEHPEFKVLLSRFIDKNPINSGDVTRLWTFVLNAKQILEEKVPGDFAEVGVWRGNTGAVLAHYAAEDNRNVFLFDTYTGFDLRDLAGVDDGKQITFKDTSVSLVREVVGQQHNHVHYVQGFFPDSVTEEHARRQFALVSLDVDLYAPTKAGLEFFYPRLAVGGILLVHDYKSRHWSGVKKAVDEFCIQTGERIIVMPDKAGSALIRKTHV